MSVFVWCSIRLQYTASAVDKIPFYALHYLIFLRIFRDWDASGYAWRCNGFLYVRGKIFFYIIQMNKQRLRSKSGWSVLQSNLVCLKDLGAFLRGIMKMKHVSTSVNEAKCNSPSVSSGSMIPTTSVQIILPVSVSCVVRRCLVRPNLSSFYAEKFTCSALSLP